MATIGTHSTSDESDFACSTAQSTRISKVHRCKIIDALDKLCVYTRGCKFKSEVDLENVRYNHIFSLKEDRLETYCGDKTTSKAIEKHNTQYLMRTYPKTLRVKSSNFEPITHWRRGVQMAALNYQTYDEGMQINEAMFASGSDRLGYVLKPLELRAMPTTVRSGPFAGIAAPVMDVITKTRIELSLDLISAQFLETPRKREQDVPNPWVEVQIYVADDRSSGHILAEGGTEAAVRDVKSVNSVQVRRRSAIVPGNGYNPFFGEHFRFYIETRHPELVFVRLSVRNSVDGRSYHEGDAEATFTAKYMSLGAGYRHVPLSNHNGEQFMFSTLFCRIGRSEHRGTERVQHQPPTEKVGRFRQMISRKSTTDRKNSLD